MPQQGVTSFKRHVRAHLNDLYSAIYSHGQIVQPTLDAAGQMCKLANGNAASDLARLCDIVQVSMAELATEAISPREKGTGRRNGRAVIWSTGNLQRCMAVPVVTSTLRGPAKTNKSGGILFTSMAGLPENT